MTPCRLAGEKYVASNFTVEENSILVVERIPFFEMLVSICQTTRCYCPYDHNLIFTAMKTSCHKNLRSRIKTWFQNHMPQSCSLQVVNVNWYSFPFSHGTRFESLPCDTFFAQSQLYRPRRDSEMRQLQVTCFTDPQLGWRKPASSRPPVTNGLISWKYHNYTKFPERNESATGIIFFIS